MVEDQRARYPHVETPLRLRGVELPNRIVRAAHVTGFPDGGITQRHIDYQVARARGGYGLIILEYAAVHPSCHNDIHAFLDATVDGWAQLAAAVHAEGTKLFQQLWHGGSQGRGGRNPASQFAGLPGPDWAPSAVPDIRGQLPVPMTQGMINEIVEGFASAARRCEAAGLDGVEIHAGHGYLIHQFLSPLSNRRSDGYGGPLENRLRFIREVLSAVRGAVSDRFVVGVRVSATESVPGGIDTDDAVAIAKALEADGHVDYMNVSMGSFRGPTFNLAMEAPHLYEIPYSERVTSAVNIPTMVNGRILSLAEAESLLERGVADLVGMTRASIADPEIVSKSLSGREAEVRPCISCNQGCLGKRLVSTVVECAVNPHVGFESQDPFPRTERVKRVMVIGAGPAGMSAARTARLCGHDVSVYEALDHTGGQAAVARLAPHREDFGRVSDWLAAELDRLDVPVHLGVNCDASMVRRLGPDLVIVATGAEPRRDAVQRCAPGITVEDYEHPHVITPFDLPTDLSPLTKSALVFDDLGTYAAVGAAEWLLEQGLEVTFATSHSSFAPGLLTTFQQEPAARRLAKYDGYRLRLRTALESAKLGAARLRGLDDDREEIVASDLVVIHLGSVPRRRLHDELAEAGVAAVLVGDAVSTADVQEAITSGYRAAVTV
jgi:2,4-dienoyl-CoA reductase-like NADH-dependent reductase (Old Yellow Enzyme family)